MTSEQNVVIALDVLRVRHMRPTREELEAVDRRASERGDELPYVELTMPLESRRWLVHERIPVPNVSMLGGDGSIGKSLLLMQLSGAVVLGKEWIGTLPEQGTVLYMSCEEDDAEVRRRMEDVARHLGSTRAAMEERGLCFLSFAGRDAILAQPNRTGVMRPTPLFENLKRDALAVRPKLIVLDNLADIFGGREIDRAQTRQFVTLLRGLAIESDSAVVISAHPSLTGKATDTGLSGSTGWHNSVRARMYLKALGEDTTLRVLEVKKNNYGPVTESIVLRWCDGVYVVAGIADQPADSEQILERLREEEKVDQLFLTLLRRFTKQGRKVSDKASPSYAPSVFAQEPEAKKAKAKKPDLAAAMVRLFAASRIKVVTEGPPSRERSYLVEAQGGTSNVRNADVTGGGESEGSSNSVTTASSVSSNDPSNDLPTPSNDLSTHTPHTPQPVGTGQWALEEPARSTGAVYSSPDHAPPTFGRNLCRKSAMRTWLDHATAGTGPEANLIIAMRMDGDMPDYFKSSEALEKYLRFKREFYGRSISPEAIAGLWRRYEKSRIPADAQER